MNFSDILELSNSFSNCTLLLHFTQLMVQKMKCTKIYLHINNYQECYCILITDTETYAIHRNVQRKSMGPREGAHLASKALATALTRVKFSLLYISVRTLPLWEVVVMAR